MAGSVEGEVHTSVMSTSATPASATAGGVAWARRSRVAGLARADARRLGLALLAVGVLALALAFHVTRLTQSPGWDPQEGYTLDLAWNLLHGRLRLFALTQDFAQHPPLFSLQLALVIRVFGYGMGAIRGLVAVYAVLTCAAVLGCGRRLVGTGPALWAGLAFTAAPIFLANTRWGYSYAALMPLVLLCVWALDHYAATRGRGWLLLAALLAGVATLSDYEGVALVLSVALAALWVRRRDLVPALAIALGVPVLGLLACLAAAPSVFVADAGDTFGRAAGGNLALQLVNLLVNYYRFITLDPWLVVGVAGLLLVRDRRRRTVLLVATGVVGLVVLKVRAVDLSFHTAVPLLPLLALGAGVALDAAVRRLYAWAAGSPSPSPSPVATGEGTDETIEDTEGQRGETSLAALLPRGEGSRDRVVGRPGRVGPWWRMPGGPARRARNLAAALLVFVVVVSPLAIALAGDGFGLATTLTTREDGFLGTPGDAQAAAAYVLAHARPGDVTLGSPQVVWMLDQPNDARGQPRTIYAADILQALAFSGQTAAFYPAGLGPARWAFDVAPNHVRFVIVDNLARQLAAPGQVDGMPALLRAVETWPAVYRRGQYTVYERPATGDATLSPRTTTLPRGG